MGQAGQNRGSDEFQPLRPTFQDSTFPMTMCYQQVPCQPTEPYDIALQSPVNLDNVDLTDEEIVNLIDEMTRDAS